MLGTMMVGNVLFVIIPGHWELVHAKRAGREPDPVHGIKGKQRSVHNNYLTLPVVLAMLGPHFPFAFAGEHGWLVLVALMLVGAWIRLYFNLRHRGRTVWWIPASAALAVLAIAIAIRPDDAEPADSAAVPFAQVAAIVEQRCAVCHSHDADRPVVLVPAGGNRVRHAGADPAPAPPRSRSRRCAHVRCRSGTSPR